MAEIPKFDEDGNELLTLGEVIELADLTPEEFERLQQSQKEAYEHTIRWLKEHEATVTSFADFLTDTLAPLLRDIEKDRVLIEIIPRAGLTIAQLMDLGEAVQRWHEAAAVDTSVGLDFENPPYGLNDLLAGELPAPISMQLATALRELRNEEPDDDSDSILKMTQEVAGLMGNERTIRATGDRNADYSRAALIIHLQAHIPSELVDDVLVEGKSWSDPG